MNGPRARPRLARFLLALACILASPAAPAAAGGAITIGIPLEPPNLDPSATSAEATQDVLYANVYEGLTRIAEDGRVVPALARDWSVSGDGLTYRFHLRAGVDASVASAKLLLESICAIPRHEFWPDDASYLEMPAKGIIGHRQVTDAYLVLLARKHGGSLATMDAALAAVHAGATLINP